jgi:O-antigen/teichoic acid export membrane protein
VRRGDAQPGVSGSRRPRLSREGHTARAAGLAGAQLIANVLALAATIAFARALGTDGYGELARMVSIFTIMLVPASALQAATARETALGRLGDGPAITATLRSWLLRTAALAVVVAVGCALLRDQLAEVMQVREPWAAATVLPAGVMWGGLALMRGVLQGLAEYRLVGLSLVVEQAFRLLLGLVAAAAIGTVTAIFIAAVPLAIIPVALMLGLQARRLLGAPDHTPARTGLRALARRNPVPVLALTLFAVVQNMDVVAVAYRFGSTASGAYAEAAVAAKGIVWVAVGLGLYLLPEATRETASGRDARHLLGRTAGLLSIVAVPMVLVYAVAAEPVLDLVFGDEADLAAGALPWLGGAMSLLGMSFLAVQFSLGIGRHRFVWAVGAMAVAVPGVILIPGETLTDVGIALLGLNAVFAAVMFTLALRPVTAEERANVPAGDDAEALLTAEASAAAEAAIP